MNNVLTQAMADALDELWKAAEAWAAVPANAADTSAEATRLRIALDELRVRSSGA